MPLTLKDLIKNALKQEAARTEVPGGSLAETVVQQAAEQDETGDTPKM